MGRLGLGKPPVWLLLGGMNQIGKLDGVLDEEDRNVVAHQIPVALSGVQLHREAAYVPGQVAEPLFPATVEKRTKAGVRCPGRWNRSARVTLLRDS